MDILGIFDGLLSAIGLSRKGREREEDKKESNMNINRPNSYEQEINIRKKELNKNRAMNTINRKSSDLSKDY